MINPYAIIALLVAWVVSIGGAFWYGGQVGEDHEVAKQAGIDKAIADTRKAANEGAANAIANIQVTNTTIQGRIQTIVKENVVYRDCKHTADGLRILNEAITGRPGTDGDRPVPRANAVN